MKAESSSTHWLWAAGFLGLCVVGIGVGALRGIAAGLEAQARRDAPDVAHTEPPPAPEEDDLASRLRSAIFLGRQGELESAEAELVALAERHPQSSTVWLNLGVVRLAAERLDGARTAFERVLALSPEDWDAHAELAALELERGALEEALRIAGAIPPGAGRMPSRLRHDPRWTARDEAPGVQALRSKHGLGETPDQSERAAAELRKRREEAKTSAAPATGPRWTPAVDRGVSPPAR